MAADPKANLSMFEGVTSVMFGSSANVDEMERSARKALNATGAPQAVHTHPQGVPCVRGGGCFVLRRRRCPDDGACHHECVEGCCFRVACCGPLSGVYPGDEWPKETVAELGKELGERSWKW